MAKNAITSRKHVVGTWDGFENAFNRFVISFAYMIKKKFTLLALLEGSRPHLAFPMVVLRNYVPETRVRYLGRF